MAQMTVEERAAGGARPQQERRGPQAEPRTRPHHITDKRGAAGTAITLRSNFVTLRNRPNCAIYQYNVSYSPPIESRGLRCGLLRDHESLIGNVRAFDGMILYLPHRLPDDVTEVVSTIQRDNSQVRLKITLTNEVAANSPVSLQLFNVIFRKILGELEFKQIGRHYYNPKKQIRVPQHKLDLWPGFVASILQYEDNVMLCADVSHKIMRADTVYDYLDDLFRQCGNDARFHDTAMKNLVGEIVLTRYNNKTYRIDDIDWDHNPTFEFETRRGKITMMAYYKEQYGIDIGDRAQPLLVSKPKQRDIRARGGDDSPILLVPELCTRTGLSDEARADFNLMKDIAVYTRISPETRMQSLTTFMKDLQSEKPKQILNSWNLEFDKEPIRMQGRVLPPESIYQRGAQYKYDPKNADWSREMRGKQLLSSVEMSDYMILFTGRDAPKAQDFIQTLQRVGPPMGFRVGEPYALELQNDRTDTILRTITKNLTKDTQMVIVVLPSNRKDRYDSIKKLCCVDHPVPSQCLLQRTLSKKNTLMSVTTKVAMQLNCKLGGELWALEVPLKKLMVVGVDSYHDSSSRGRSVCGFIASTNNSLTRYYTQCKFQHTGQELADNLKLCMTNALKVYHSINNSLPERIVVYRDGVGDGQLPAVVEHEVPQIMSAFKEQTDYNPKFGVVVVKKRINSRMFAEMGRQLSNPPPGTIVDTVITKPEWYDFFLVSQSVRQGTVTPTHFNVICDTTGLRPDHMQRLTYKLCHLYYNWPGTIRVPAPCQYAHKLAFLVGQSIHKEPDEVLADRLYFL